MALWENHFQAALRQRENQQNYRIRSARAADEHSPFIRVNGKRCLNFGGNDYLGLSNDPEIIATWQHALAQYGCGSTGSSLVCGHTDQHQALEEELATWLGYPHALLFASGFAANQAVLLGLLGKEDIFLADKLCHASMQEAAALSPARYRRFAHQRYDVLSEQLTAHSGSRILVASEGVFSMDGDRADLSELGKLCAQHQALLMIDDAHGIGAYGTEGRGSIDGVERLPDILVVTFGKAVGSMGAAVLCSHTIAEYLTQFARHLVYSTAIPPAQAAALRTAFARIRRADDLRSRLQNHIRTFQAVLTEYGLATHLLPSDTAIQPFICGDNDTAIRLSAQLRDSGFYVPAIRPPTVPQGQARLRITLTAAHETEHIQSLAKAIHHAVNR